MVVIRPTGSLAKRMKVKLKEAGDQSSTLLGDWYALDMVLERQQYILCVCENGRLPVVLKAAPYGTFPQRLLTGLAGVLRAIGTPGEKIKQEIAEMTAVTFAKTNNRSVVGSMNEFRFSLQASAQLGRLGQDPLQMSLWLANMVSVILPDYTPEKTVLRIFDEGTSN